jgi:hypothetical protein
MTSDKMVLLWIENETNTKFGHMRRILNIFKILINKQPEQPRIL